VVVNRLVGSSEREVVKALEESEAEYRTLLENAPAVIATFDLKGKVTSINRAVEEYGFTKDKIVGKYLLKFISKSYWQRVLKDFVNVSRGEIVRGEIELITPRGKKIAEYRSSPIRMGEKVVGIQAILRDVTESRKAEERIRASEERYRSLVELAPDSIMTFDLKGVITSCNTASTRISGYSKDELVGKHFTKIGVIRSRDIFKYLKMLASTMRGKVPEPFEVVYRRKDGTFAVGEVRVSLMREGGKTVGIQAIMRDVTERKQMEEALAHERDFLHALMDNIPDAIYFKDAASHFTRINRAEAELLGLKDPGEAVGKTDFDFFTPEHARDAYGDEKEIVRTGQPLLSKVEKSERPDGYFVWHSTTKVPIRDKDGQVVGTVGISRDITDNKRMEEELRQYSERLEELVEERTRKLREAERLATIGKVASMVGHDLRNPLTGISGAAYFLKMKIGPLMDEKLKEMLDLIEKNVEYSNNIINDLAEYSGDIQLKHNETSAKSIIGEALSLVEVPRNIQVSNKSQDEPKMNVDVTRMKRVFFNLIKNAVEAMPSGGTLTMESRNTDGNVELKFIDTGTGIPEDVLEKLFTPFFTTKSKGMGLGLSICKRIVEAHEGTISVESIVGKGTTFTVTLPTKPKNEEHKKCE